MYSICSFWYALINSLCDFLGFCALLLIGFLLLRRNAVFTFSRFFLTWKQHLSLPPQKKDDHRITKNYRSITLPFMGANFYNDLLLNHQEPKTEKILCKIKMVFEKIDQQLYRFWHSRILKGVHAKDFEVTPLFVDSSQACDSIHSGKMKQILLAYGLPKETVLAIMILYENTKVKVRSPDGHTDFFDIVAGRTPVSGYISPIPVQNLPRLCTSNVKRSNKRKPL